MVSVTPSWSAWHRRDVEAIAARLGVPLLAEEVLAAAATEFGSPVPAGLRGPAAPA